MLHSRLSQQQQQEENANYIEQSWIYNFCLKCRGEDDGPSWEPPHWQKICPYPLCPTFRQFSRILSLIFIGKFLPSIYILY